MTSFRRLVLGALALMTVLSVAAPALAQSGEDQGIGIGVLAGIARPKLTADDSEDFFDSKTGTLFGLWVGGNKGGVLGFTGEFNYVIRKADVPGGELSYPAFQIPAVFHINVWSDTGASGKGRAYAVIGPVFSFNLSQKLNGETVPDQDEFKGADIGILGGGGFEILRIGVEVRGNWGLRNISSEGTVSETKSRSVEFLVKFRFN
jgi:hypothetical protein